MMSRDEGRRMTETNPVRALLLGLPEPVEGNEVGKGVDVRNGYQSRAIFESSEAS